MPEETYAEKMATWDDENLRSILKLKYGREFLWRLLETYCYVDGEPAVFDNANATYHNLGRQAVGKKLKAKIISLNPEAYLLMLKYARQEEKYAKQAADKEIKEKGEQDNA